MFNEEWIVTSDTPEKNNPLTAFVLCVVKIEGIQEHREFSDLHRKNLFMRSKRDPSANTFGPEQNSRQPFPWKNSRRNLANPVGAAHTCEVLL